MSIGDSAKGDLSDLIAGGNLEKIIAERSVFSACWVQASGGLSSYRPKGGQLCSVSVCLHSEWAGRTMGHTTFVQSSLSSPTALR